MKRIFLAIFLCLLMVGTAMAQKAVRAPSIIQSPDCSWLIWDGTLCQDTDDHKIYKWNGATQVELAAGSSGDVVGASTTQTWGAGTTLVWTFSVTGTDPTFTFTAGQLDIGASTLGMTGSLGATGARVTKGWFTNLEITNAPTINGAAWTTILQPLLTYPVTGVASPTAGYLTKWGVSGNAIVDGPKLGTLTDTKWCTFSAANGLQCTSDTPAGTPALDDVTNPDAAKSFTLLDNSQYSLDFGATGKTHIFWIDTRDGAEGVGGSGYASFTGLGTFGTLSSGAGGFTVDADGDVVGKSFTAAKADGVAGTSFRYEANSTDTNGVGNKGPDSRASDLYLQDSDSDPAANQFQLFPAPTGDTSKYVWTTYGQFGALPIVTTGTISGLIPTVEENTATTFNVTQAQARAGTFFLNINAATKTFVLPSAEAGMAVCIKQGQGVANILRVDTDGTDYIVKSTGARTSAAGDYYGATADAKNQICLVCFNATDWYVTSEVGTWTEE